MTNSANTSAKPVPAPPVQEAPIASREELIALLTAGNLNVTVK